MYTCNVVISVKVQVEVTLIFILINYLTLLARIFFGWRSACTNFFLEKLPLQEFFWGNCHPPPPPGISNGPPLTTLKIAEVNNNKIKHKIK